MTNESIEYITEDHYVMMKIDGDFGHEWREDEAKDLPESCFAQYMNHLLDQVRLCWEVIRNREVKS